MKRWVFLCFLCCVIAASAGDSCYARKGSLHFEDRVCAELTAFQEYIYKMVTLQNFHGVGLRDGQEMLRRQFGKPEFSRGSKDENILYWFYPATGFVFYLDHNKIIDVFWFKSNPTKKGQSTNELNTETMRYLFGKENRVELHPNNPNIMKNKIYTYDRNEYEYEWHVLFDIDSEEDILNGWYMGTEPSTHIQDRLKYICKELFRENHPHIWYSLENARHLTKPAAMEEHTKAVLNLQLTTLRSIEWLIHKHQCTPLNLKPIMIEYTTAPKRIWRMQIKKHDMFIESVFQWKGKDYKKKGWKIRNEITAIEQELSGLHTFKSESKESGASIKNVLWPQYGGAVEK